MRIILPILIGLGVVVFFMSREFDVEAFRQFHFAWKSVWWLFVAFLFMAGRDMGYMWRLRILSERQMTWQQVFRVIMLWEFTSAITPSAVGGTSVAVVYVHKEGVNVGRSSAIVMLTSLLDELYFIIMFPILMLLVNSSNMFDIASSSIGHSLYTLAIIGYSLKLAWVLLLLYGMFVNPQGLSKLIQAVFKLPFLRRWKKGAEKAGADIINSSVEFKKQSLSFWLKAALSSFLSWTSRYFVVNAMLLAFFPVHDHLLIFARQLVMFLILLIMPTPGGSGFAEYVFKNFLGSFIPVAGLSYVFALLWRLITYYPYLIIGAIIVPRWISAKFGKKLTINEEQTI